jgi:hypothetical protein
MCQNVPEEIRIREKTFVQKAGRISKFFENLNSTNYLYLLLIKVGTAL